MAAEEVAEFLRLVDKSGLRRIEISRYLGIGERTYYRWQNGEVRIPRMALIALCVLVGEPLPERV